MIVETVTITNRKIVVSYSGDDLSLMTPEMEAKLRAYWIAHLDRITRSVMGLPERDVPAVGARNVPEREQPAVKDPFPALLFPSGN